MKSLRALNHELSAAERQLEILESTPGASFGDALKFAGRHPLRPSGIDILQVNVGKMCNQTCAHCHVDAGPDRKEIMTRRTMRQCLEALKFSDIGTVDLTGGAPEMNPNFRWFVEEISRLGRKTMVRSNLTILTVNEKYRTTPEFFARHGVTVVSSLPCYTAENTDKQRGEGVFDRSIEALRMLNDVGYGKPETGLELHLVYNPLGAFLPPPQEKLRADYKRILKERFDVEFNDLYCITNMPISRFLDYLLNAGKYEKYMETLVGSFNPSAVSGLMCRNTLSVGWEGTLYDCDFNQMLELPVEAGAPAHISEFNRASLEARRIVVNRHCFGCTAGAGSSCGGEIVR